MAIPGTAKQGMEDGMWEGKGERKKGLRCACFIPTRGGQVLQIFT